MPVPADYRELPDAALDRRAVEALWSFEASSPGRHRVLPDGRMDLVVRFRRGPGPAVRDVRPRIVGPSGRASLVPVAAGDCFLGLRFRPGRGGDCLGVAPGPLRDAVLRGREADRVLGQDAVRLRRARSHGELLSTLLAVGARHAAAGSGAGPGAGAAAAVDLLHLSGGRLPMADLARLSGVPERTLRRQAADLVGVAMKAFAAVLRFQRTMRLLAHPGAGITLVEAALEGGYSDQAHMTREFRRLGAASRPPSGRPSRSAACRCPAWPNCPRGRGFPAAKEVAETRWSGAG